MAVARLTAIAHAVGVGIGEDDELLGIGDGERADEDRIEEREDGGIGTAAERERENGYKREAWIF